MDEIAQQLRSEIRSLQDHIERTGNRVLVTQWTEDMIGPFEQIETTLDTEDLRSVVAAFHHARNHFMVNGHLADRLDEILARHDDLVAELETGDEIAAAEYEGVLSPDADPGDTTSTEEASSLFLDEDEEILEVSAAPGGDSLHLPDFGSDAPADGTEAVDFGSDTPADGAEAVDFGSDAPADDTEAVDFGSDAPADATEAVDFGSDAPADGTEAVDFGSDTPADATEAVDFGSDAPADAAPPRSQADAGRANLLRAPVEDRSREGSLNGTPVKDRSRKASTARPPREPPSLYSIFAHTITVDDVAAALDLVIPGPDRILLDQQLRVRLNDRVVAALREDKTAQKQYILLPRLARARQHTGDMLPLTVKNLAKRYISLFGDIRDLVRYRNNSMMSTEVPELGWAFITMESPKGGLGKNYMEQNQFLHHLSTSLSLPAHLLRRRTMVEAIYDLILGELILGQHLQRGSLDWTASSPAKDDYVCVYYPEEGIRVRDVSRVSHHPSLGVTPNW
jgi:hypothetical protein